MKDRGSLRRAAAVRWDALRRTPARVLAARLRRRLRFGGLYPWAGERLFPAPRVLDSAVGQPGEHPFREAARATPARQPALLEEADRLRSRVFAFLNLEPRPMGRPVDWERSPSGNRLWAYTLHYGEWALTLGHAALATGREEYRDALLELLADWLDHNRVGSEPGWEPYPLSRRLVAWSRLHLALERDGVWRRFWPERLEPSLRRQAAFLRVNLEHDVPNNHLIANYRALAWVGLLFGHWPEAERLRRAGLEGLWREMRRQVLPDGVHDERSISYHTLVLMDLLETWRLAMALGEPVPPDVEPALVRMFEFLAATAAPDGSWPMLNDTVPGYPIDPRDALLAGAALFGRGDWRCAATGGDPGYAAWLGSPVEGLVEPEPPSPAPLAVFADAGYAVARDELTTLYFDAGPMGPDRILGHGHADTLGIVLYGLGRPMLVDPGVCTYEAGSWRDHFRSTAAHNTVTVDGEDQCVFWGPFRASLPAPARLLEASAERVAGEHLGYRRLTGSVIHRREVVRHSPGVWELVDRLDGSGRHDCAVGFQLAIGAQVAVEETGATATWPDTRGSLRMRRPNGQASLPFRVSSGWSSVAWNLKHEAPRLTLAWTADCPVESRVVLEVIRGAAA